MSFLVGPHFIAQRRSGRSNRSDSPLQTTTNTTVTTNTTTTTECCLAVAVRIAYTHASSASNKRCVCVTDTHARPRGDIPLPLSLSRVCEAPRNGGKRTEEFFRLTDEARSSLLECHCKVQGVYVPFRAPTSTPTHVHRAAPCRLHLHLHPRTRIRFVLIYVNERRGAARRAFQYLRPSIFALKVHARI